MGTSTSAPASPPRATGAPFLPPAVVWAALFALGLKLYLAATTHGSSDIEWWRGFMRFSRVDGGERLYAHVESFNHPPFMVHALAGIRWLFRTTGLAFPFCMRLPAILADLGSLVLVARILAPRIHERSTRLALALMAAAPVSIMVSGFHGNTDPVMVFFLLLSLGWIDAPGRLAWAGAAFGMGVNVKVVPLLFAPLLFLHLGTLRQRLTFFGPALLVVVVASMPYLATEPVLIARRVLGYHSAYGLWGLTRIADWISGGDASVEEVSGRLGTPLLLLALLGLSWWTSRTPRETPLFRRCAILALAVLALAHGFGIQYLVWLVPFVVEFGPVAAGVCYLTSGLFAFAVYTYWSGGFPWTYANAEDVGVWGGRTVVFEVACWVSVVAILLVELRSLAKRRSRASGLESGSTGTARA